VFAQRGRYAHHIGKAERAQRDAQLKDDARVVAAAAAERAAAVLVEAAASDAAARRAAAEASVAAAAEVARVARTPTCPEVVSCALDCGSSQKMGTLPSLGARPPKQFSERTKLECKAMGVIVHGHWRSMLLFPGSVEHGANMTCEAIFIMLKEMEDKFGCVPPNITIQLDNCSDNKCKTVCAFLFDLRRRGILRKCTSCMLEVGHTHIDIDQMFGVYSRALTREEALSLLSYERILKAAFRLEVNAPKSVKIVEYVHDWEQFYKPCLDPRFKGYGKDSKSGEAVRVFKYQNDSHDRAKMFYKDHMTSSETKPRPYHAGRRYTPSSDVEATSVFGSMWTHATADERLSIRTHGLAIGGSTFCRSTKQWHTELPAVPGVLLKAQSPGISLFLREPEGEPAVAPVPAKWYRQSDDRSGNVFGAIERTIRAMVAADYFKFDPKDEAWWESFLTTHRPRDDGGSVARDQALRIPFSWPRASPTVASPPPPSTAPPQLDARPMADQIETSEYTRSMHNRAQATLDEEHPTPTVISADVGQIMVIQFRYTAGRDIWNLALVKVVSIDDSGPIRDYTVLWLCRQEKTMQRERDAFSLNGRYRPARASDYGPDQVDQSTFSAAPTDIICVLAKTSSRAADVPVTSLNATGTIPNFALASGLSLREFIAKAIADQRREFGNF